MATFNDFIQIELPKRPFAETDGTAGQVLVRSNNPLAPREVVFVDASGLGGTNYGLVTTDKTPIINNKILLPSEPKGDIVFNTMLTYQNFSGTDVVLEYDGVTIYNDSGTYYAELNEPSAITGFGVVSYLAVIP